MTRAESRVPTLHELQQWMAARVLEPERAEQPAGVVDRLERCVAVPQDVSPPERLNVHVHGYPARIREALAEAFPALAHVIGDAAFTRLTKRYIRDTQLRSFNLNDAGADFPVFLQRDELSGRFPFLADLAELEWRVMRAFHSHERRPVDPEPLTAWTLAEWEAAVLRFQPSVAVVSSSWPIREIWQSRHTPVEGIDIDLRDKPENVLVHRTGLTVHCELLLAGEAHALAVLLDCHSLGEVCRRLESEGYDAAAVLTWFTRWMSAGLIVDCSTPLADPVI